jgi:outer membrane protein OmpA-like peptidoglycan-associated protein
MKNIYLTPAVLAIAALVSACGSAPKTTSLLEQTRSDYLMAQSNPNVASYAALELKLASEALEQANAAANHNDSRETIDKLAYLANRKVALTQEVAKQKSAEAEVAMASKERDQIRLDQRTNEADQANRSAEQSRRNALIARGDAAEAQRDTEDAQRKTQEAQARTAQLEAQLADLAAKKTERGMVITLSDVLFGTDLARLNADGMRTAQKLSQVLQQNPQRTVLVEGFTDSTGTASHNLELSDRRAGAVRTALLELGVPAARIATHGYGESHPIAANDTAEHRQLNRRVEIILSDDSGKIATR